MVFGETEIVLRLFFGFLFLILYYLSFLPCQTMDRQKVIGGAKKIELNRLFVFKYLFYISCMLYRPSYNCLPTFLNFLVRRVTISQGQSICSKKKAYSKN